MGRGLRYKAYVAGLLFALATLGSSCAVKSAQPSKIDAPGCRVDLKQLCQAYFDLPDEYLAPDRLDSVNIQRAPNKINVFFPAPPAIVWCTYDKTQREVTAAGLGQEEPMSPSQVAKAREMGFCTEDGKELAQALIREEKKRMKSGPGGPTGTFIQPLTFD